MPLFEYECRGCGRRFEHLARTGQSPSCPSCQGDNLQKLLSVFGVRTNAGGLPQDRIVTFGDGHGDCGRYGGPQGSGSSSN